MELKLEIQAITADDVRSVYSGRANTCACGCAGKYHYNSKLVDEATADRGYAVTPDEVNDAQIRRVLAEILTASKNNIHVERDNLETLVDDGFISYQNETRMYVAYLSKAFLEKCRAPAAVVPEFAPLSESDAIRFRELIEEAGYGEIPCDADGHWCIGVKLPDDIELGEFIADLLDAATADRERLLELVADVMRTMTYSTSVGRQPRVTIVRFPTVKVCSSGVKAAYLRLAALTDPDCLESAKCRSILRNHDVTATFVGSPTNPRSPDTCCLGDGAYEFSGDDAAVVQALDEICATIGDQ